MWTANIVSISKSAGKVTIRVEYANGDDKFQEEYMASNAVDLTWLKNQVRNRLDAFKAAYAFADTLAKDQPVDLTPPAAPTQAQIDREAWLAKYTRWLAIKRGIDNGIIDPANAQVVAFKQSVIDDFKVGYLQFM